MYYTEYLIFTRFIDLDFPESKKYYLCGGLSGRRRIFWRNGPAKRDRRRGECGGTFLAGESSNGEMAERSNAAVLKTVILYPRDRGFESLFLRQRDQTGPRESEAFCFKRRPNAACRSEVFG